jgi:hypothetical protein
MPPANGPAIFEMLRSPKSNCKLKLIDNLRGILLFPFKTNDLFFRSRPQFFPHINPPKLPARQAV